jgi:hypothetical protein
MPCRLGFTHARRRSVRDAQLSGDGGGSRGLSPDASCESARPAPWSAASRAREASCAPACGVIGAKFIGALELRIRFHIGEQLIHLAKSQCGVRVGGSVIDGDPTAGSIRNRCARERDVGHETNGRVRRLRCEYVISGPREPRASRQPSRNPNPSFVGVWCGSLSQFRSHG